METITLMNTKGFELNPKKMERDYKISLIRTILGREKFLEGKKQTDFDKLYDSGIEELENYDSQLEECCMQQLKSRRKGLTRFWNGSR
jgi:hypothetical protein